jgi:hypothetical protein
MELENNIYMYIGLAVVILIAVCVISKTFKYQMKIMEGLANNSDATQKSIDETATELKATTTKASDALYLNKYRKDYETLIINLEDNANTMTMKLLPIIANTLNSGDTKDAMTMINNVNSLNTFKATLNDSMKFLDAQ